MTSETEMDKLVESVKAVTLDPKGLPIDLNKIVGSLKPLGDYRTELAQQLLLAVAKAKTKSDNHPRLTLESFWAIGQYENKKNKKTIPLYLLFPLATDNTDTPTSIVRIYMERWKKIVTHDGFGSLQDIRNTIKSYIDEQISEKDYVECFHIGVTAMNQNLIKPEDPLQCFTNKTDGGLMNRLNVTYAQYGYSHMICLNALEFDKVCCPHPLKQNRLLEKYLFNHYSDLIDNGDTSCKFRYLPTDDATKNDEWASESVMYWKPGGRPQKGKKHEYYYFLYAAVKLTDASMNLWISELNKKSRLST